MCDPMARSSDGSHIASTSRAHAGEGFTGGSVPSFDRSITQRSVYEARASSGTVTATRFVAVGVARADRAPRAGYGVATSVGARLTPGRPAATSDPSPVQPQQ